MTGPFPLGRFVSGKLPAAGFDHRFHVQAAYALLEDQDFATAASSYAQAIRTMAHGAGQPGKFHMTITVAMLSAVAERMPQGGSDFDSFAVQYPELFDREFLSRHYSKERLQCDLARRAFLLPDRA